MLIPKINDNQLEKDDNFKGNKEKTNFDQFDFKFDSKSSSS